MMKTRPPEEKKTKKKKSKNRFLGKFVLKIHSIFEFFDCRENIEHICSVGKRGSSC